VRGSIQVLVALALCLGARSEASAQTAETVTIEVDATSPGVPLERVWAFHGYDEVNYTTMPEGRELLRTLAELHSAPVRVRTHFLFNTGDGTPALKWGSTNIYTEDADGSPVYDFTLIDGIMDATLEAGALPLVELGFMPAALSTMPEPYRNAAPTVLDGGCFYPPRDYDAWGALVRTWAEHVRERYAGAASSFQWELWNEPDIGYWHGTFEEFARLYDHTQAALHAVFPEASLGGPAVARADGAFLVDFLEHCATGTNAVTGRTGTRLDMVSFHAKGGVTIEDEHVQMDLGNQLRLHRAGFDAVRRSAVFARTPIVISEADPDGCAACPATLRPENAYRTSTAYGAYELAMMKRSLDLAAEMDVDLRGILTWAFTFPGSPYFAGYRELSTNGIHLPVLNAFKLLGSLRGVRLPVSSSGAKPLDALIADGVRDRPDIDALAARDGDRIQILVWNYHDDLVEAEPATVSLDIAVPAAFGGSALVQHTRVDDAHGNAFAAWVAQGRPVAPTAEELATLREAMEPVLIEPEHTVATRRGAVRLTFSLPRFGMSLLTLAAGGESPSAPSPPSEPGCSCRSSSGTTPAVLPLVFVGAFAVGGALAFARRVRRPRRSTPASAERS
jgi:xylan 1,4-beta-xylosidase